MENENQRVAITKRLLKNALIRLTKDCSLDKITISQLCREAGINRATFYRHYEMPRDVMAEMERELFNTLRKQIKSPTSTEDVYRFLEDVCQFMADNSDTLRALVLSNSDDVFVSILNEIYEEIIAEVAGMDMFRKYDADGMKIFSLYCSGGSYFLLRHWLLGELEKTPQEIAAMAYSLMVDINWRDVVVQLSAGKLVQA